MNKKKKQGALFYVLAVLFFPITLTVLIVRLCVRQKEKPPPPCGGKSANVIGETIGGKLRSFQPRLCGYARAVRG
ncbi:MAG: hypothetical protein IJX96_00385 [Clostridia bacterium]|nr:hypothetical protein [Clostridia bacterium]